MISLLVWLLVLALVIVIVVYVIDLLPLPDKIKVIAKIVIGIIFLLVLLQAIIPLDGSTVRLPWR